jgi:hypothetical protein
VTPRKKPTTAASQARPSSKQDLLSENRPTERGRCHAVVTTRSGFGESTRDAKIRFLLVRRRPELLRDNGIRPMSDWGSSGRRFKSCQPDTGQASRIKRTIAIKRPTSTPPKRTNSSDASPQFKASNVGEICLQRRAESTPTPGSRDIFTVKPVLAAKSPARVPFCQRFDVAQLALVAATGAAIANARPAGSSRGERAGFARGVRPASAMG